MKVTAGATLNVPLKEMIRDAIVTAQGEGKGQDERLYRLDGNVYSIGVTKWDQDRWSFLLEIPAFDNNGNRTEPAVEVRGWVTDMKEQP